MSEQREAMASQEKHILADLNRSREKLTLIIENLDKLNRLVSRIDSEEKKVDAMPSAELKKAQDWSELTLRQKVLSNRQLADRIYDRLSYIGERLNSFV